MVVRWVEVGLVMLFMCVGGVGVLVAMLKGLDELLLGVVRCVHNASLLPTLVNQLLVCSMGNPLVGLRGVARVNLSFLHPRIHWVHEGSQTVFNIALYLSKFRILVKRSKIDVTDEIA